MQNEEAYYKSLQEEVRAILAKPEGGWDNLAKQSTANSEAFQAQCKEDMKKIKTH